MNDRIFQDRLGEYGTLREISPEWLFRRVYQIATKLDDGESLVTFRMPNDIF